MCDLSPVTILLSTVSAFILGAQISLGVAIGLNNGFFSAPGAPIPMGVSGGLLAAAAGILFGAMAALGEYATCADASRACANNLSNVQNALAGLATLLAAQSIASFAAAGVAWIPWVGQAPMWVILGSLLLQAGVIPLTGVYISELIECVQNRDAAATARSLVSVAPFFTALIGVFVVYQSSRKAIEAV
jgi:hypothetical protein